MSFFFFFNYTATTEIYTLSLHDALPICTIDSFFQYNTQVVSDFRFVIFEDENTSTFKLKPKPGLGNFTYHPSLEAAKYIFKIRITVNGDGNNVPDEIFIIDNVEINLQNVAPVVLSSGNIEAQQNNDDILGTPIHQIIATNGSASQVNNTSGLSFRCRDLQSQFITTTNGLEGFEAIFDEEGDLIPELRINTSTGEIFLTSDFNEESLNVNFVVRITDANDFLSDENFQSGTDEHGGIFIDHQITLTVSDGLIVLGGVHWSSVAALSPDNNDLEVNVFQNEGDTRVYNSDPMFRDNSSEGIAYGSYWTSTPTGLQVENLVNNQNILNTATAAGLAYGSIGIFLCSETKVRGGQGDGVIDPMITRIWALRVIDNVAKVVTYYKETAGTGDLGVQSTRQWYNHHLYSGWGHIHCLSGRNQQVGINSTGNYRYTSSFADIDGVLSPNPDCRYHPSFSTANNGILVNGDYIYGNVHNNYSHQDITILGDSGWLLNTPGTHPRYGSQNSNDYEGSFPYYNNEGEIVNTISKPEDMNSSSGIGYFNGATAPPFQASGPYLGKCHDTVVLNGVEYNILYVYLTGGNYGLSLSKVFLCRKQ